MVQSSAKPQGAAHMPRAVKVACAAIFVVTFAVALVAGTAATKAFAATGVWTATVTPTYQNPITGQIEDSAGSSNVALAESMVSGVTYPSALVEQDADGTMYVTLRFNLASQTGNFVFDADGGGDGAFVNEPATLMQSDAGADTADYRFPVTNENSVIRVSMFVTPMGRSVVFFEQLSGFVEGNTDAVPFVESVSTEEPAPAAEEPAPAAEEPAPAQEAPADNAQATPAPSASSSSANTSSATPSTDNAENKGVQEFNADGQEVSGDQQQAKPLSGTTIALIIGGVVVVAAIVALIVYFASVKPKRAKQAAAAAAASAAAAAAAKPRTGAGASAEKAPAANAANASDTDSADAGASQQGSANDGASK